MAIKFDPDTGKRIREESIRFMDLRFIGVPSTEFRFTILAEAFDEAGYGGLSGIACYYNEQHDNYAPLYQFFYR